MSKRWLLMVFDGRRHDLLLHRIGLRPSRGKAGQYIGFYATAAKPQLLKHIENLKTLGLRGIAKLVAEREATPSRSRPHRTPAAPSAEIIRIQTLRENRLAQDALKYAIEKRRQAERVAERDASDSAKRAIRRIKGEV